MTAQRFLGMQLREVGSRAAVALSALGAVFFFRFVDLPAVGPLPAMYEPIWYPEKSLSALAEAGSAVAAALGLRRVTRRPA